MTRTMDDVDLETPEFDAAEQAVTAAPGWTTTSPDWPDEDAGDQPSGREPDDIEVSEWDAEEQRRVVAWDDDYR
ncbi:hypothetical protein [Actinoplanes sp. NPDC051851]|uniref:hypothetical protein n=1 Tax=Actinoplanes sp. NPDC051851 TaxID=3154753 RepID=UPI00342E76A5